MSQTATLMIAVAEARNALRPSMGLEERIKAAMKVTKDHWMERDEQAQYRAALAAAVLETTDPAERERLTGSSQFIMRQSSAMIAILNGVSIDASAPELIPPANLLPLVDWWREA